MKLHDHQEHAVNECSKTFRRNKRVILNAATGFGKTVTAADICKRALSRGNSVCILVHRKEIMAQFFATLRRFDLTPSLIAPGRKHLPKQPIYLGMVETFRRRMKQSGFLESLDLNLLVCDEVHYGSYESIVNHFPAHVLGLTATPKSASGLELNQYFDTCISPIKITDLIGLGYLVSGTTYSIDHDFSKVKMSGRDFSERDLVQEFKKPTLYTGALTEYEKHAKGLKAICYSVNVEQSIDVALQFQEAGYQSFHVDSNSEDRDEIFDAFGKSENAILFNVGIATTGYDEPSVRCIIQNFATAQITKHVQTVGRGARIYEGKRDFKIIDMGRNFMRHGLYGEDVDWIAIFHNPKLAKSKKEESQTSVIECSLCAAIVRIQLDACPYCGTKIREDERESVVLEHGNTKEIREYKLKSMPVHLRGLKPSQMNWRMLEEYAEHMGYKPGWVRMQKGKPWMKKK